MKLEELYTKTTSDEALKKAYMDAASEGKLAEFLKANGCEATEEELKAFLDSKENKTGELADDELDQVAGGGCEGDDDNHYKRIYDRIGNGECSNWMCRQCGNVWDACFCSNMQICHWCMDCKYFLSVDDCYYCTLV